MSPGFLDCLRYVCSEWYSGEDHLVQAESDGLSGVGKHLGKHGLVLVDMRH